MTTTKRILFYLLITVGALLTLATLASLLYDVPLWFVKVLDFPREQVFIALVVCLVLLLLYGVRRRGLWYWLLVAGLGCSVCLQAYIIYPYTGLADKAVPDAAPDAGSQQSFSLLLANVWMKNRDAADLLDIIREEKPDIIIAMETNAWWANQLATLEADYPHKVLRPLDNTYGMVLYSKLPLQDPKVEFLNYDSVPSMHARVQLPNGDEFLLHAMHPVPPIGSKLPGGAEKKEVELLKVGDMVANSELPVVVAGDFNDVAWSNTSRLFGQKSKLNDVRIGRGFYNSFNAQSFFQRWPLDHVYVSNRFRVAEIKRMPKFGSDHFPVLVRLTLEANAE